MWFVVRLSVASFVARQRAAFMARSISFEDGLL